MLCDKIIPKLSDLKQQSFVLMNAGWLRHTLPMAMTEDNPNRQPQYNGALPNGDRGRRKSRFALYKRPKANGVKPSTVHVISTPQASKSTGSRHAGSVVVAHGPSCSAACGIFPDQGSNPLQICSSSCFWCLSPVAKLRTAPGFGFGFGPTSACRSPEGVFSSSDRMRLKEQLLRGLWLTQAGGGKGTDAGRAFGGRGLRDVAPAQGTPCVLPGKSSLDHGSLAVVGGTGSREGRCGE
ncbi:hypothetical protein J1605_000433 [Eschrichtius robustus]|uniref:Pellino FHA domain-containing protein n=1 Tax=Eschrichtius robustus TaxID=9764 RepID=A0AB34HAZ7_ESCRO|nr:hypothetical protein J1605_000433 [Eschrichtius robustus]